MDLLIDNLSKSLDGVLGELVPLLKEDRILINAPKCISRLALDRSQCAPLYHGQGQIHTRAPCHGNEVDNCIGRTASGHRHGNGITVLAAS